MRDGRACDASGDEGDGDARTWAIGWQRIGMQYNAAPFAFISPPDFDLPYPVLDCPVSGRVRMAGFR